VKPYLETHRFEGVIEAPPARAWALRVDPVAQLEAFSHRLEVTPLVGRPGEVGAVTRHVNRLDTGAVGTAMSTVLESEPPHRAVFEGNVLEAPRVHTKTTVALTPEGRSTRLAVDLEFSVAETTWLQRVALRRGQARRRAEGARLFAFELAEENAYHRAHPA